MGTDEEEHAGPPGARAGGVFAGPLTSELADGPSITPLSFAPQMTSIAYGRWPMADSGWLIKRH